MSLPFAAPYTCCSGGQSYDGVTCQCGGHRGRAAGCQWLSPSRRSRSGTQSWPHAPPLLPAKNARSHGHMHHHCYLQRMHPATGTDMTCKGMIGGMARLLYTHTDRCFPTSVQRLPLPDRPLRLMQSRSGRSEFWKQVMPQKVGNTGFLNSVLQVLPGIKLRVSCEREVSSLLYLA